MRLSDRRRQVRLALLFKQNRTTLLCVLAWFALNLVIFSVVLHHGWSEAAWITFYFKPGPGRWGSFYTTISDFVVFGMVITVAATDLSRRYRPEQTSAILAREARDHVVIVGYTNFGRRVVELCLQKGAPFVVVDDNRERVASLLQNEHPLVIASGIEAEDLEAASVARAKMVVLAEEGVEVSAIAARRVRTLNGKCALVARCSDDDVAEVIGRTYKAKTVSTTRLAAKYVEQYAAKNNTRRIVVVGNNSLASRIHKAMRARGSDCVVVDENKGARDAEDHVAGSGTDPQILDRAGVRDADLVVLTGDDLGHALVVCDRVRDVNVNCRIVCRVFHEDAAALLTQAPFKCEVVSTSRYALRTLAREGVFEPIGVTRSEQV